jgi:hypothetical protein
VTGHARRVVKTVAASLFVLLLAGVTYQGVATALERRSFRYPGRLVPVGDHQLHVHCVGAGLPVVVLEAPAMGFSASWQLVQANLEATTRVCAYDRAGLGWSEASDRPFDAATAPAELHALLEGAGEVKPYVLVTEGLGEVFATGFAKQFADDTAAVVIIGSEGDAGTAAAPRARLSPWLARTGILRLSGALTRSRPLLPGPNAGAVRAFSLRPDHLTRGAQEMRQLARIAQTDAPLPATIQVHRLAGEATLLRTSEGAAQIAGRVATIVSDWRRTHE